MFGYRAAGAAMTSIKWAGAIKSIAMSGALVTVLAGSGCVVHSLKKQGAMAHELRTLREGRELVAASTRQVRAADQAALANAAEEREQLVARILSIQSLPESGVGQICPLDCTIPEALRQ